jgi:hypothetical protein
MDGIVKQKEKTKVEKPVEEDEKLWK